MDLVYLVWIHGLYVYTHDMNTWSMYIRYEYVKYVYMTWICEVCTYGMNTWNMYNGNWCPWDTMFDTYMTWGSCNIWQTERKDMKR